MCPSFLVFTRLFFMPCPTLMSVEMEMLGTLRFAQPALIEVLEGKEFKIDEVDGDGNFAGLSGYAVGEGILQNNRTTYRLLA